MEATGAPVSKRAPGGRESPPGNRFRRWTAFVIGILLLGGFVFFVPKLENVPNLGPQISALRESDVETGAFFYGEVKIISEIEYRLLHLRDYLPRKNVQ